MRPERDKKTPKPPADAETSYTPSTSTAVPIPRSTSTTSTPTQLFFGPRTHNILNEIDNKEENTQNPQAEQEFTQSKNEETQNRNVTDTQVQTSQTELNIPYLQPLQFPRFQPTESSSPLAPGNPHLPPKTRIHKLQQPFRSPPKTNRPLHQPVQIPGSQSRLQTSPFRGSLSHHPHSQPSSLSSPFVAVPYLPPAFSTSSSSSLGSLTSTPTGPSSSSYYSVPTASNTPNNSLPPISSSTLSSAARRTSYPIGGPPSSFTQSPFYSSPVNLRDVNSQQQTLLSLTYSDISNLSATALRNHLQTSLQLLHSTNLQTTPQQTDPSPSSSVSSDRIQESPWQTSQQRLVKQLKLQNQLLTIELNEIEQRYAVERGISERETDRFIDEHRSNVDEISDLQIKVETLKQRLAQYEPPKDYTHESFQQDEPDESGAVEGDNKPKESGISNEEIRGHEAKPHHPYQSDSTQFPHLQEKLLHARSTTSSAPNLGHYSPVEIDRIHSNDEQLRSQREPIQISTSFRSLSSFSSIYSKLSEYRSRIIRLKGRVKSSENELERVDQENEGLRNALSVEKTKHETLKQKLEEMDRELDQLRKEKEKELVIRTQKPVPWPTTAPPAGKGNDTPDNKGKGKGKRERKKKSEGSTQFESSYEYSEKPLQTQMQMPQDYSLLSYHHGSAPILPPPVPPRPKLQTSSQFQIPEREQAKAQQSSYQYPPLQSSASTLDSYGQYILQQPSTPSAHPFLDPPRLGFSASFQSVGGVSRTSGDDGLREPRSSLQLCSPGATTSNLPMPFQPQDHTPQQYRYEQAPAPPTPRQPALPQQHQYPSQYYQHSFPQGYQYPRQPPSYPQYYDEQLHSSPHHVQPIYSSAAYSGQPQPTHTHFYPQTQEQLSSTPRIPPLSRAPQPGSIGPTPGSRSQYEASHYGVYEPSSSGLRGEAGSEESRHRQYPAGGPGSESGNAERWCQNRQSEEVSAVGPRRPARAVGEQTFQSSAAGDLDPRLSTADSPPTVGTGEDHAWVAKEHRQSYGYIYGYGHGAVSGRSIGDGGNAAPYQHATNFSRIEQSRERAEPYSGPLLRHDTANRPAIVPSTPNYAPGLASTRVSSSVSRSKSNRRVASTAAESPRRKKPQF